MQPASVSVVVAGPAGALARLKAEDLRPFVEITGKGDGPAPVAVEVGAGNVGVSVEEVRPARVALRPARRKAE